MIKEEELEGRRVYVSGLEHFLIEQIFDCGQSFRFKLNRTSEQAPLRGTPSARAEAEYWRADGIAFGRRLTLLQPSPDALVIYPCTLREYLEIWKHYLALDVDHAVILREMLELRPTDATLRAAMEAGKGIRILRQEPWETLCTFMISQNNNIPRITGLVDALCRAAGEPIDGSAYAFPTPQAVLALGTEGLAALKMGFRAPYIFDAAAKVSRGEIDLSELRRLETSAATKALCAIRGVGPKVAACSLLFGLEKDDAFPIDVWVKRVMAEYYPDGIEPSAFGSHAGLAQQYLFYYRRYQSAIGR